MNKRLWYPIYALLCGFLLTGAAHAGTISVDLWELDSYCDSGGSCTVFAPATWIATIGTIDDSTLPVGYSVSTLSTTGISLFGSTEYWIGLSTSDSNANWAFESGDAGLYVSGEYFYNNLTTDPLDNSNNAYLMTVVDALGTEFDSIGSGPLPAIGQDNILSEAPFASFYTGDFTGFNRLNQADLASVSVALDMPAPEPGCAWLLGAGLAGLLAWRVRSRIAGRALAAVLTLAAGLGLGLPARAQESLRPAIHHPAADEVQATRAYWTKERMASAIPAPLPVAEPPSRRSGEPPVSTRLRAPEPEITVIPGYDLAAAPKGVTPGTDPGLPTIPAPTGNCTSCVGDYNCQLMNSTFAVPVESYNTTPQPNLPYSAIGKLFFTGYDGSPYVCSGASIGGSAVLTAGHCVSDGKGHFNSNFIFVPDIYGDSLYGGTSPNPYLWVATHVMTFQDFLVNGNSVMGHLGRDIGFAIMQGSQNGVAVSTTLSDSVGHLGFAWNLNPTGINWDVFGYPTVSAGGVFNGWQMGQTNATTGCRVNYENPAWVAIGSGMWEGSSGSPWLLDFWPTLSTLSANYVGGISTYVHPGGNQVYGPYFDASVKQLKDIAVAAKP